MKTALHKVKIRAPRAFPNWLIAVAAIGIAFFAFVILSGVLFNLAGRRAGHPAIMVVVIIAGLAAAYFAFRYSRRFMLRHVSKARAMPPGDAAHGAAGESLAAAAEDFVNGDLPDVPNPASPRERSKRLARTLFFAGVILFPAFLFTLLSSIINVYVQNSY